MMTVKISRMSEASSVHVDGTEFTVDGLYKSQKGLKPGYSLEYLLSPTGIVCEDASQPQ